MSYISLRIPWDEPTGFLTTRRTAPRFGECASGNREDGPLLGNMLDLKARKSKLKHLVREAPCGYGLEECNISSHFICDYGL